MINEFYRFRQVLQNKGIFFCFNGPISQNILVEIGSTLKQRLTLEEASKSTVLRLFSMVVEHAQNIMRYSDERLRKYLSDSSDDLSLGTIVVGHDQDQNQYFVICGNIIETRKVDQLRQNLSQLKMMNKDELKLLYKHQLKKDVNNSDRGAGLGFIEMARKASKPIEFDFQPVDDTYSFFTVKTVI